MEVKPGLDEGFMRGFTVAIGPCLIVWALIMWMVWSGWSA